MKKEGDEPSYFIELWIGDFLFFFWDESADDDGDNDTDNPD